MRKYFVDTENVSSAWLALLFDMTTKDRVYLLVSPKTPKLNIPLENLNEIAPILGQHVNQIEQVPCANMVSHNGMDMELVSYMGKIIGASKSKICEYIVISNDSDFDPVVKFWEMRGKRIRRLPIGTTLNDAINHLRPHLKVDCPSAETEIVSREENTPHKQKNVLAAPLTAPKMKPPHNWEKSISEEARHLTKATKTFKKKTETNAHNAYKRIQQLSTDDKFSMLLYNICHQAGAAADMKKSTTRYLERIAKMSQKDMSTFLNKQVIPNVAQVITAYQGK